MSKINPKRLLRDAGVAAALLLALALVFWLGGGRTSPEPSPGELKPVEVVQEQAPVLTSSLRLAVTPPEYDDMGRLLDTLGAGYRYANLDVDDLLSAGRLRRSDVVFATCGGVPQHWLGPLLRDGERGAAGVFRARPAIVRQIKESLRDFAGRGGTLYASDWRFELLAMAFPEFVDKTKINRGDVQTVDAEVVDPGLQKRLGPRIALRFDKPSWRPAAFDEGKVAVYLRGAYKTLSGTQSAAPLMVRFPFQDGTVIFTSFHNEKQNSDVELQLLRHLVFTTVTAQLDAKIERTMMRGGFSPVERNLLSASVKERAISQTYECQKPGPLQFVLGFAARGAELRLTVVGPDGQHLEKSGDSTFTLDVPQAAAGKWTCTITPVKVPYDNFPFTLTVGRKQ